MSDLEPSVNGQNATEQFAPGLTVGSMSEVSWLNCVQVVHKRHLLKNSVSIEPLMDDGLIARTSIKTKDIAKVKDPDLRYALRFAAAAAAVGWTNDGSGTYSAHGVLVRATEEGFDSKFLSAAYTGVVENGVDTFMTNLRSVEQ